jgi:hypothetical protein
MFVIGMVMAIAAGGCVTDGAEEVAAEDTGTEEAASSFCREIRNFSYTHNGVVFKWDVTTQLWDGRQFVDERRPGSTYYRQYRISAGRWSPCWHPNENLRLTSGSIVIDGIHVCLPDGREELHGTDYQRLLYRDYPFITYDCSL